MCKKDVKLKKPKALKKDMVYLFFLEVMSTRVIGEPSPPIFGSMKTSEQVYL